MGKRGPKPKYERILTNQEGAPMFSTRQDPPIFHHIKAQPEGPRTGRGETGDFGRAHRPEGGDRPGVRCGLAALPRGAVEEFL